MALTWRALDMHDIAACAAVSKAIDANDGSHSGMDEAGLRETIDGDRIDPAVAGIGAFDGDNLVGYGLVGGLESRGGFRVCTLRGGVRPDHRRRGIGGELLDWLVERAGKLHGAPDVRLVGHVNDTNVGYHKLLQDRGFEKTRSYTRMTAEFPAPPQHATVPSGLTLTGYAGFSPELDESTRLAFNESFADHWDSPEIDRHVWRTTFTGSAMFLPRYSVAALDDEHRVASFVLGYHEADRELYLGDVGTVRAWRGHGLATLLVGHVLALAGQDGYLRSHLTVDSTSPTGAFGVYQRCGFAATSTSAVYLRETG